MDTGVVLVIPAKTTLAVINYGGTAFCNYGGTVKNDGTITITVLNPSIGFANAGKVLNDGIISIVNNAAGATGFGNFAGGTVKNDGTITIINYNTGGIGFDNFHQILNDGTISTCGSVGGGFLEESGSTYKGHPIISC